MITQIKLKTTMAGPMGNFGAGSTPSVPDEISLETAKALIAGGYAVEVKYLADAAVSEPVAEEATKVEVPTESATDGEVEDVPTKTRGRRKKSDI